MLPSREFYQIDKQTLHVCPDKGETFTLTDYFFFFLLFGVIPLFVKYPHNRKDRKREDQSGGCGCGGC